MGLIPVQVFVEKIRKYSLLRLPALRIINRVLVADMSNEAHTCRGEVPLTAARVTE